MRACGAPSGDVQPIPPTKPVGTLPGVASQVASAQVEEVATLAGLTGATAAAVTAAAPSTSAINDAVLTKLVTSKTLTDAQAKAVGFSTALYALTDQASALATAIQSATFAQLGGKAATSIADLAKLAPADWTSFLTSSNVALPAGATAQSTGVALAQRFAALEPNVAVFARLPQPTAAELTSSLATPQTAQAQLQQLSNAYPGLGLAAILDDTTTVSSRALYPVQITLATIGSEVIALRSAPTHGERKLAGPTSSAGFIGAAGRQDERAGPVSQAKEIAWRTCPYRPITRAACAPTPPRLLEMSTLRSPQSTPAFLDSLTLDATCSPVDFRAKRAESRILAPRFRAERPSSHSERFDVDPLLAPRHRRPAFARPRSPTRNSKELSKNSKQPSIHCPLPSFHRLLAFVR